MPAKPACMSRPGGAAGRRARASAYTAVTTAIVLLFALAEWMVERYVATHSRAASTAIEIAIVLVAALVFRPIHQRVEAAVEGAFYERKRRALAALAKFRRELSSFSDKSQLLRRVVEAIEHYLEARACAIYVGRDEFHVEASSFDSAVENVVAGDPLVLRLKSSEAPAQPRLLNSSVRATQAFGMTAAGQLVGFILVDSKHGDYDAEESSMLAGLAQDLAVALLALEPRLRAKTAAVPNNLPVNLLPLLGRERELREVCASLRESPLVTLTGPAGVGKTRLALQCAVNLMHEHADGAWFINLAAITDGKLVPATILAELGAGPAEEGRETSALLEHLRERDVLVVIDNCEQVVSEVARVVTQVCAACERVALLTTSRELLHVAAEKVYRLGPLRAEDAAELFARRACTVSPEFEPEKHAAAVHTLCERLDGLPLAIELAAARVRILNVDDILLHLDERFRLLAGTARAGDPRQRTLAAALEWSYDLLSTEEQSLFRRLSVFRGSFSLAAAAAVCAGDGNCDEFHVLDVLTSLTDKSLLIANVSMDTRYRLLESIREFASAKAAQQHATQIAQQQHAAYFAAAAAQAYHEFDSQLPGGWMARLAPDIDNFRAALSWTLGNANSAAGAQLAADCGPLFLRMGLLAEGLAWCDLARQVRNLSAATAGRIEYVASMLHNNLAQNAQALRCAQRAVDFYRQSPDQRGAIRALSQLAQLYARAKDFDAARTPAMEAIGRAREAGESRLLIGVLRRCAFSLPQTECEQARAYYAEALRLAQSAREADEECRVLEWWAYREADWGNLERAIELAGDGLRCADRDAQLFLENQLTTWLLALGRVEECRPHAERALALALELQHDQLVALGMAYWAPFDATGDPARAAMLFGYAKARLAHLRWTPEPDDDRALQYASKLLQQRLTGENSSQLLERGAGWTHADAAAHARASLTAGRERHGAAV